MKFDPLLTEVVQLLLRELLDGPEAAFATMLNPGDPGLLASLRRLSAIDASKRPADRSSVVAHVRHVHYGLTLLNRWAGGEEPFDTADFAEAWRHQEVSDPEWRELLDALEEQARAWTSAIGAGRYATAEALAIALGSIVHLGYHVGAIRQLAASAAGPCATD